MRSVVRGVGPGVGWNAVGVAVLALAGCGAGPPEAFICDGVPDLPVWSPLTFHVSEVSPDGLASTLPLYEETTIVLDVFPSSMGFVLVPIADNVVLTGRADGIAQYYAESGE
jgi:hypothetical protein